MIISCPSKTYLCGEYAVLIGGPALILAHKPRFQLEVSKRNSNRQSLDKPSSFLQDLHPQSPAGCFAQIHKDLFQDFHFDWTDPHRGAGGFGASGAQFLSLWAFVQTLRKKNFEIDSMISTFKSCDLSHSSGGDVLCQFLGGVSEADVKEPLRSRKRNWPFSNLDFILVSTGKKLPTHDHLRNLERSQLTPLQGASEKVIAAFDEANELDFLKNLFEFQKSLEGLGLVAKHSLVLLENLAKVPGFKGIKSCGALGADTILVLVDSSLRDRALHWLQKNEFQAFRGDTAEGLDVKNDYD